MASPLTSSSNIVIRPFQRRDLEDGGRLFAQELAAERGEQLLDLEQRLEQLNRWYGVLKVRSALPHPFKPLFCIYVAEQDGRLRGLIQVSPFNRTRSTWKVDRVFVSATGVGEDDISPMNVGSMLLRHCFQTIWEARTWLLEVNVNHKDTLALYRHNGFQPLAHLTYWDVSADILHTLAEREPDLPNLIPVSNADAGLLHQLDTVSMPPLVRQVFDRHPIDFKTTLPDAVINTWKHRMDNVEIANGYVFEPQRKAAIGFYELRLNHTLACPHAATLTVHPAYTWLYPELMTQMARLAQRWPLQSLRISSSDYHPERESYLEQIGASRIEHTLMMSRSVWHKIRETRPVSLEGLQLSEMLQSFQPTRKPAPSRLSMLESRESSHPNPTEDGRQGQG